MATPKEKTKLIVDIPADLKREFKVYCTINEIPMTEIVSELIQGFMSQKKIVEKG